MNNQFTSGDIVMSTAGHDKSRIFLVVSIDKIGYPVIIDGRFRVRNKLKTKNPKHLVKLAHDEMIYNKFLSPIVTDTEIYNMLKVYQNVKQ